MNTHRYKYELHLHTQEGSRCSRCPGGEYIAPYKEAGYDGIFVTDHFYGGNTAPDRDLAWEDYITAYAAGYRAALKEGKRRGGFKVFFGVEETIEGDDYLLFGIDIPWLIAHPEARHWNREEMARLVHEAGGCVIQAHPFRERDYITKIHLSPAISDGVEVVNRGNRPEENTLALAYAARFHLLPTVGSDIHHVAGLPEKVAACAFSTPLADEKDFVKRILAGEAPELLYPESALSQEKKLPSLECDISMGPEYDRRDFDPTKL